MTDTERVLEFLDIELNEWQLSQIRFLLEAYQPGDNLRLEFTRKGPVWKLARPDVRTNPETCLHKVVQPWLTELDEEGLLCVSCESTIDQKFYMERTWEFDINHCVWVHTP